MTQRLRDEIDSADPEAANGANLLRAVRPLDPEHGAFFRVRAALRRRSPHRAAAYRLRPAHAALVLLLLGVAALASAMVLSGLGRRVLGRSGRAKVETAQPAGSTELRPQVAAPAPLALSGQEIAIPQGYEDVPNVKVAPTGHRRMAGPPRTLPAPPGQGPEDEQEDAQSAPVSADGNDTEPVHVEHDPAAAARTTPGPSPETLLVISAIHALRGEGQPARAAALLKDYLGGFPDGVLAEEALALAVEAEAAQGRRAGIMALADEYLRRYPRGRYRDTVLQLKKRLGQ